MGEDLDGRIGAVLDRINELGIEDNTYVVMVSDNGYRHSFLPGLNNRITAHKWWVWQGGIRVPMIVKGPGIQAGSVVRGQRRQLRLPANVCRLGGRRSRQFTEHRRRQSRGVHGGRSTQDTFLNRNLYFHYPHYRSAMPHSAVVSGNRKLLHFYDRPDIPMLFDLSNDMGEVHNIASTHADEHQRLHKEMMSYFEQVGARIPKLNPDYDAEVYKQAKEYDERQMWGPSKAADHWKRTSSREQKK